MPVSLPRCSLSRLSRILLLEHANPPIQPHRNRGHRPPALRLRTHPENHPSLEGAWWKRTRVAPVPNARGASLRASNPRTLRSGPHPAKPETQLAKRSRIRTEHGTPLLLAPGGSAFAPSLTHGAGSTPADREEQVRSRFLLATVQNLYGSRLQQGMVPRTRMQNRSRSGGQDPLGG
jgi:hypothetical protein